MTNDDDRDSKHDGRNLDPNAGRRTPGQQQRVMTEEESLDTASNDSMGASDPPSMTQPAAEPDLLDVEDHHVSKDSQIWEQQGSLTIAREAIAAQVDLPPLADDYEHTGPLRLILRGYLEAPEIWRERMTLRLENGQSYNAADISELLSRDDSPFI